MATYTTINIDDEQKKKAAEQQKTVAAPVDYSAAAQSFNTAEQPAMPTAAQTYAAKATKYGYDPASDLAYQQAMAALNQAKGQKPVYNATYEQSLNDLYKEITGRDDFKYDVSDDMLYQQYKEQYANMGRLAMENTMGQAAALTGGYGSSYSQSVGQQQYDAYLQKLNEVVPELYGMAYQRYQDEGDDMRNQYAMLGQLADDEYGKYQDSLNQYWQNLSYLSGQADDAYNRGLQYAELAYEKRQDAYNNLVDMITTLGYTPSEEELEEAGMSPEQFRSYMSYYYKMNPVVTASSGGSGGYSYNARSGGDDSDDSDSDWSAYIGPYSDDKLAEMAANGTIDYKEGNNGQLLFKYNGTGTGGKTITTPNPIDTAKNIVNNNRNSGSNSKAATAAAATTGTNIGSAISELLKRIKK